MNAQSLLYVRIGGKDAINTAVDLFYKKIMDDPRINHHFKKVDMQRQMAHQKTFLTYAFGGLPSYPGKSLREAHMDKYLKEEDFNAVVGHLRDTLEEMKVEQDLISEVLRLVGTKKDSILNR